MICKKKMKKIRQSRMLLWAFEDSLEFNGK